MTRKHGRVIQRHHITYTPEYVVTIFKGEHDVLSRIQRYEQRTVSQGFIEALKVFIAENEDKAIDLNKS